MLNWRTRQTTVFCFSPATNRGQNDNKHGMTLMLVKKLHPTIGEKYKLLKDVAHTSRYHDYNIAQPVVAKVRQNLKVIEEYCENKYKELTTPKEEVKP